MERLRIRLAARLGVAFLIAASCKKPVAPHSPDAASARIQSPAADARVATPTVADAGPRAPAAVYPAITPASISASSLWIRGRERHPGEHAFDGTDNTAWNEGTPGPGTGEWIQANFNERQRIRTLRMKTGWDHVTAHQEDLFAANSHFQRIRLEFDDGQSVRAEVRNDQREYTFTGLDHVSSSVRIVAEAVYPGTRWQDLCISEVVITGERVPFPPPAEGEARVEVGDDACTLRASAQRVTATCARGAIACTEVARADIAPMPGDEVVSLCTATTGLERAFMVLSTASAVISAERVDIEAEAYEECEALPRIRFEAVNAVDDAPRELLMHISECNVPGSMSDWDTLWKWHDDGLQTIAEASVECSYTGSTGDPDEPAPPENERYRCSGGYLDVGGAARGWVVTTDQYDERSVSGDHDANGRVLMGSRGRRQTQRWDASAFRFAP